MKQTERNRAIFNRWLNGETLQSIADSYGVTRERIRQVSKNYQENLDDSESPAIMDRIITRTSSKNAANRHDHAQRMAVQRELRALFKTCFDRDLIVRIIGMEYDPDICACSDEQLCTFIFESFGVRRFFKYLRCPACEKIKSSSEFCQAAIKGTIGAYCRPCSTDRHRQQTLEHQHLIKNAAEAAKLHPNRTRIYTLRSYYRHQGRENEMPPLPPRGVPDSKIITPPKQEPGLKLKQWRESVGRVFNRAKAADKAKKLVKEDAASRHIEL